MSHREALEQMWADMLTVEGNIVLHAIRTDSGAHRSYRVDRMERATVTSQVFSPRYFVELTSTGPLPVAPSTANLHRAASSGTQGPTYVYQCPYCRKTFNRKTMDSSLNAHKTPQGYPCPGRTGTYLRTNY